MKSEAEIRCPRCAWRPTALDRWQCYPGCDTVWNTFWTRGLCPGCGHQWLETACLKCRVTSPHEQWYHYPDGQSVDEQHANTNELEHA